MHPISTLLLPKSFRGTELIANLRSSTHRNKGFSLIEIMVGMTIGLLGTIIIMQMFSISEARKRTTTSGDNAQNTAAIALYGLQRDVQLAGYGTSAYKMIGCNVLLRAGVTLNSMAPVTINHASIPAGDSNTDTMLIVYGNGNGASEGDGITAQPATATYAVQSPTSFTAGDQVIAETQSRPSPCNLTLDQVASVSGSNVTVATGVAGMTNGTLFNLGQAPKVQAYAIRNGNLTVCDYTVTDCSDATKTSPTVDATVWVPIASNIVSLKVQYGHDTSSNPMDGVMDIYDQTTPTTACGWVKTSAIRLALVARSAHLASGAAATTAAPSWAGTSANNPTGSAAAPIVLSANSNWQQYRYKTFQTVVPIKNVAWQGVVTGC